MELEEAIKSRRSIRFFQKKQVPDKLIKEIIETAQWAPSACNRQAWRFIIVRDPGLKRNLIKEGTAFFIEDTPLIILVLYDNRTDNLEYQDHIQSASALIQNFHLLAHEKGLGTCWVNNLPIKKRLRKLFKIPKFYEPISLIAIGYPDKTKELIVPKRLNELDNLISNNYFNFKERENLKKIFEIKLRRIVRRSYFRIPKPLKMVLEPFARKFEKKFDKNE